MGPSMGLFTWGQMVGGVSSAGAALIIFSPETCSQVADNFVLSSSNISGISIQLILQVTDKMSGLLIKITAADLNKTCRIQALNSHWHLWRKLTAMDT